jgi:hypothetical protein
MLCPQAIDSVIASREKPCPYERMLEARVSNDIEIAGHHYEILFGTDVSRPDARNGVFIEMNELGGSGVNPIIFAFRSNASLEITISMYREDVALQVLLIFLRVVQEEFAKWPADDGLFGTNSSSN